MLWQTSLADEVVDGVEYRNVWQANDPGITRDAILLGKRLRARPDVAEKLWPRACCVAAYLDGEMVGLAVAEVRLVAHVLANMAVLTVYTVPPARTDAVGTCLTVKSHEIMRRYGRDRPENEIAGTLMTLAAGSKLGRPVSSAFMTLIGYSPSNQPMLARWFEKD
jgi:hypothetical protein